MRLIAILLAVLVALAGCSSSGESSSAPPSSADDSSPDESTPAEPIVPVMDTPVTSQIWLDADGLEYADPGDGVIPLDCAYRAFTPLCDFGDMEYTTEPFDRDVILPAENLFVTLWLVTDAAAVGNPAFDLAVWVGTEDRSAAFSFTSLNYLSPGTTTEVRLQMNLENGPGLYVAQGERLMLRIIGAYTPEGAGLHKILTGGEYPSGFSATWQNQTDNRTFDENWSETFSGSLSGGSFIECNAGPDRFDFDVAEDADFVRLGLDASGPTATPVDVDLDLFDGASRVSHAGSPYPYEEILLAGEMLDPYRGKTLSAAASICLGPTADYDIEVTQG